MIKIEGIIPPIITPMNHDESINLNELKNQLKRLVRAGVHGIFVLGTNGEGYILSREEKEKVLSATVEECKGIVPIYAGTGGISTKDTISFSKRAKEIGADILSIITPYFAQSSQDELYEHFKAIASEVDLPIVLYNIPARTGNSLSPSTVRKLSEIENIAGVKDSSGNFDNMLQYIEQTRDSHFSVLSGNDSLIYWNLMAGGQGGIAGCANVYPENMVSIFESFIIGDLKSAQKYQERIRHLRNCFKYGNPNTIIKKAVELLGHPVGPCRSPFNRVPTEGLENITRVLNEYAKENMR